MWSVCLLLPEDKIRDFTLIIITLHRTAQGLGDMQAPTLTSDQLEEIREAFKLFDTDDSGTIDSDGAF